MHYDLRTRCAYQMPMGGPWPSVLHAHRETSFNCSAEGGKRLGSLDACDPLEIWTWTSMPGQMEAAGLAVAAAREFRP